MTAPTPEAIAQTLERLRLMRHARAQTAPAAEAGNLVPMLTASAEWAALGTAIAVLEERLREVAS